GGAAALLAEALTAVIPATLAGSNASAIKRAIACRRTGRSFMFPPYVVWSSPQHSGAGAGCFGENPMNVQLSRDANRPVLWQRNADWSRCRSTRSEEHTSELQSLAYLVC